MAHQDLCTPQQYVRRDLPQDVDPPARIDGHLHAGSLIMLLSMLHLRSAPAGRSGLT